MEKGTYVASKTPAQIQSLTMWAMAGVAAAVFLLMAGMAGWHLWHKRNLASTHERVTAKVEQIAVLCAVEKKSGKTWRKQGVYGCDEAKRIVTEQNGALTPWRSREGEYATISYRAGGADQSKVLPKGLVAQDPVSVGSEFVMYADKADPQEIERPYEDADSRAFWMTTGIGALVAAAVGLLGWGIASFNRRRQDAAIAAGGSVTESGGIQYPANTLDGAPQTLLVPTWAKVLNYAGLGVLGLGLLLGLTAIAGASGDPEAMRGGLVICILAAGIWRLCKYISNLAKRPAPTAT